MISGDFVEGQFFLAAKACDALVARMTQQNRFSVLVSFSVSIVIGQVRKKPIGLEEGRRAARTLETLKGMKKLGVEVRGQDKSRLRLSLSRHRHVEK
jgi:hypothetical protein